MEQPTPPAPDTPEFAIQQILTRALTDPEFKALLLTDPDKALENYTLTEVQQLLLKSMDEGDFEKLTLENLHEHFSADSAVYTPEDADQVQLGYDTPQAERPSE